jgi:hypothetical protein
LYSTKIIEKVNDLEEVGHLFNSRSKRYITDLNFLKFWLTNPPKRKQNFFILYSLEPASSGRLIIGRIFSKKLGVKFGYKNLFKFNTKCLEIFYEGILGDFSESQIDDALLQLRRFIKKHKIDYAIFNSLRAGLPFYDGIKRNVNVFYRNLMPDIKDRWTLKMPDSFEEYFQKRSKNTKSNIRKWRNKMEKSFAGNYEIRCYKKGSDINKVLNDIEKVYSKAWKGGMGVGFSNTEEEYRHWSYFASCDWLRIYILYIKGEPVAHWSGVLYKRIFNLFTTDFDPEYQNYNPGFFLLINMINDFISAKEVDLYDFGLSGSHYKRLFCDLTYNESDIFIFAQSTRGLIFSFLYNTSLFGNNLVKFVLIRLKILEKIKSFWRKAYTPRAARL